MIKGVTHAHLGPIWYLSEPSDDPYSPNQFLGWDFFRRFLQQTGSNISTIALVDKISSLNTAVQSRLQFKLQTLMLIKMHFFIIIHSDFCVLIKFEHISMFIVCISRQQCS